MHAATTTPALSTSREVAISLQGVSIGYNGNAIIESIDLDILAGEILFIGGGSGSGKTTLLSCLTALRKPIAGSIVIDGVNIADATDAEIQHLRDAQAITEQAIQLACGMIASATAGRDGILQHQGEPLTSERVRAAVDHWLLDRGFSNPMAIIAGGPTGADCQNLGFGELRTGEPVIVDIFPRNRRTRYNGDCTRTVVHGDIPDEILRMHAAVRQAKAAAEKTVKAGVTGEAVHLATIQAIQDAGYAFGLPAETSPMTYCAMTHGTGHGIGLDVHEPPLLDRKGPVLLAGEALTVEPGLYCRALGGVRIEDMVVVTDHGCDNLNALPDGLCWK